MQSAAQDERRQHPRCLVEVEAMLFCGDGEAEWQTVAVHDISLSGMAIYQPGIELAVGCDVCICLSGGRDRCDSEHMIKATVVRGTGEVLGLHFNSVGIHVLKDIHRLLRQGRTF